MLWFNPQAAGPYDYMSFAGLPDAVDPPGPLRTSPGKGGNYQIVAKLRGSKEVDAAKNHIQGHRHHGMDPHWSSPRAAFEEPEADAGETAKRSDQAKASRQESVQGLTGDHDF